MRLIMHAGFICKSKVAENVLKQAGRGNDRARTRTENRERERQSETESDIDQSGGEWDKAALSALAPTANQRDRVYIWPRNGPH